MIFRCVARPLKWYHAPPWGSAGGSPWIVTNLQLLKRFKVLKNESIFQKYQHFFCSKIPFLYEKSQKIEHILHKFLNFYKFLLMELQCKARDNTGDFYYLVEKFVAKFQILNISWIFSTEKRIIRKQRQHFARLDQKWRKIKENFQ